MRVLTIVRNLNPGGTQRVACNFAAGYRRHEVESALLAYEGGGTMQSLLNDSGVEVFTGGERPDDCEQALSRALAWQPDVVHIHRPGPAHARTGAMLRTFKTARRANSTAPVGIMETNVFGRVDYSSDAHYIDVHLQLSKWCLWRWTRWAQAKKSRPFAVVLPNLVMHEQFGRSSEAAREEFRRRYGITAEALVFGRIGSRIPAKWSDTILSAFRVYTEMNPAAWLLLVGVPEGLKQCIARLPDAVRDRVTVIDYLHGSDALNEAYSAMDVFLHASRIGESFGMVLTEAALCGVPAITLSTPARDNSQLEVVGHERGGLVVANVAGMVEAMSRLKDPELRRAYALRAADEVKTRYGADVLIPQALRIAELAAAGLPRAEFQRRVLAIPHLIANVSGQEIEALRRNCLGDYRLAELAQMRLATHPFVYRAYLALRRRSA
jgi:glycosyltransferase involved in cell wall biosynthesis